MEKVFKALWLDEVSQEFASAGAFGEAEVVYKIGEWTVAPQWLADKGYHLLVFDSLENAMASFADNIFECEVEGRIIFLPERLNLLNLSHGDTSRTTEDTWPKGTRMYKRVKILKRVKE